MTKLDETVVDALDEVLLLSQRVEKRRAANERWVNALGREVREKLLVPLCKAYGATYLTGNGTFFISLVWEGEDLYVSDVSDIAAFNLSPAFLPALKALNLDVYSFNHGTESDPMSRLGYYIEDVRGGDLDE